MTNQELAKPVRFDVEPGIQLYGDLHIPSSCKGLVVFSHGSGSSRHSPRNRKVASELQQHGMGTFLFDLLTEAEDQTYANRFNIALLTERLVAALKWLHQNPLTKDLPLAIFGASTGAASALMAAAKREEVVAVVSRGGRPDLAMEVLPQVKAAVLIIVGGLDTQVLELNESAYARLTTEKKMVVISGASHLFEEEGKLEAMALVARNWLEEQFEKAAQPAKYT